MVLIASQISGLRSELQNHLSQWQLSISTWMSHGHCKREMQKSLSHFPLKYLCPLLIFSTSINGMPTYLFLNPDIRPKFGQFYFQNSLKTGHFFLSSLTLSCSKSLPSFAWVSLLLAFLASSSSSRALYQKVDDHSIHSVDSHEFRRVQTSSHGLKTLHNLASAHLFSLISCTRSLPPDSVAFNVTRFVCLFVCFL